TNNLSIGLTCSGNISFDQIQIHLDEQTFSKFAILDPVLAFKNVSSNLSIKSDTLYADFAPAGTLDPTVFEILHINNITTPFRQRELNFVSLYFIDKASKKILCQNYTNLLSEECYDCRTAQLAVHTGRQ
ncbi:MAG: hypothetical protein K2X31_06505, partial [Sphingopyxis sp.]|nr:hypothetical protein [Sphingopyxis sp.]